MLNPRSMLSRERALQLLRGATRWRAFVNASEANERRAQIQWARWIETFEPDIARRGEVTDYCSQLATLAHKLSLTYAANDPTLD